MKKRGTIFYIKITTVINYILNIIINNRYIGVCKKYTIIDVLVTLYQKKNYITTKR